jgi:exosortase A-associated hydrolase 1
VPGAHRGNGGCSRKLARVNFVERALTFECRGETLVGVLAEPEPSPATIGIIIIVGGPQYRAGSHRQFVHLSRQLARGGVAAMRFDYRGMGDSTGSPTPFDEVTPDIAAAIDTMRASCPTVTRIVLCGLCDAASAALIYWQATRDKRVVGMVLLNPWVRSENSIARVRIKHYYGRRFFQKEFWAKLAGGGVDIGEAVRAISRNFMIARRSSADRGPKSQLSFQDRMADGFKAFDGCALLILSGRDLTAKEFLDYAMSDPRWAGLLDRPELVRHELDDADHTFSSDGWRREVEMLTIDWLCRSFSSAPE